MDNRIKRSKQLLQWHRSIQTELSSLRHPVSTSSSSIVFSDKSLYSKDVELKVPYTSQAIASISSSTLSSWTAHDESKVTDFIISEISACVHTSELSGYSLLLTDLFGCLNDFARSNPESRIPKIINSLQAVAAESERLKSTSHQGQKIAEQNDYVSLFQLKVMSLVTDLQLNGYISLTDDAKKEIEEKKLEEIIIRASQPHSFSFCETVQRFCKISPNFCFALFSELKTSKNKIPPNQFSSILFAITRHICPCLGRLQPNQFVRDHSFRLLVILHTTFLSENQPPMSGDLSSQIDGVDETEIWKTALASFSALLDFFLSPSVNSISQNAFQDMIHQLGMLIENTESHVTGQILPLVVKLGWLMINFRLFSQQNHSFGIENDSNAVLFSFCSLLSSVAKIKRKYDCNDTKAEDNDDTNRYARLLLVYIFAVIKMSGSQASEFENLIALLFEGASSVADQFGFNCPSENSIILKSIIETISGVKFSVQSDIKNDKEFQKSSTLLQPPKSSFINFCPCKYLEPFSTFIEVYVSLHKSVWDAWNYNYSPELLFSISELTAKLKWLMNSVQKTNHFNSAVEFFVREYLKYLFQAIQNTLSPDHAMSEPKRRFVVAFNGISILRTVTSCLLQWTIHKCTSVNFSDASSSSGEDGMIGLYVVVNTLQDLVDGVIRVADVCGNQFGGSDEVGKLRAVFNALLLNVIAIVTSASRMKAISQPLIGNLIPTLISNLIDTAALRKIENDKKTKSVNVVPSWPVSLKVSVLITVSVYLQEYYAYPIPNKLRDAALAQRKKEIDGFKSDLQIEETEFGMMEEINNNSQFVVKSLDILQTAGQPPGNAVTFLDMDVFPHLLNSASQYSPEGCVYLFETLLTLVNNNSADLIADVLRRLLDAKEEIKKISKNIFKMIGYEIDILRFWISVSRLLFLISKDLVDSNEFPWQVDSLSVPESGKRYDRDNRLSENISDIHSRLGDHSLTSALNFILEVSAIGFDCDCLRERNFSSSLGCYEVECGTKSNFRKINLCDCLRSAIFYSLSPLLASLQHLHISEMSLSSNPQNIEIEKLQSTTSYLSKFKNLLPLELPERFIDLLKETTSNVNSRSSSNSSGSWLRRVLSQPENVSIALTEQKADSYEKDKNGPTEISSEFERDLSTTLTQSKSMAVRGFSSLLRAHCKTLRISNVSSSRKANHPLFHPCLKILTPSSAALYFDRTSFAVAELFVFSPSSLQWNDDARIPSSFATAFTPPSPAVFKVFKSQERFYTMLYRLVTESIKVAPLSVSDAFQSENCLLAMTLILERGWVPFFKKFFAFFSPQMRRIRAHQVLTILSSWLPLNSLASPPLTTKQSATPPSTSSGPKSAGGFVVLSCQSDLSSVCHLLFAMTAIAVSEPSVANYVAEHFVHNILKIDGDKYQVGGRQDDEKQDDEKQDEVRQKVEDGRQDISSPWLLGCCYRCLSSIHKVNAVDSFDTMILSSLQSLMSSHPFFRSAKWSRCVKFDGEQKDTPQEDKGQDDKRLNGSAVMGVTNSDAILNAFTYSISAMIINSCFDVEKCISLSEILAQILSNTIEPSRKMDQQYKMRHSKVEVPRFSIDCAIADTFAKVLMANKNDLLVSSISKMSIPEFSMSHAVILCFGKEIDRDKTTDKDSEKFAEMPRDSLRDFCRSFLFSGSDIPQNIFITVLNMYAYLLAVSCEESAADEDQEEERDVEDEIIQNFGIRQELTYRSDRIELIQLLMNCDPNGTFVQLFQSKTPSTSDSRTYKYSKSCATSSTSSSLLSDLSFSLLCALYTSFGMSPLLPLPISSPGVPIDSWSGSSISLLMKSLSSKSLRESPQHPLKTLPYFLANIDLMSSSLATISVSSSMMPSHSTLFLGVYLDFIKFYKTSRIDNDLHPLHLLKWILSTLGFLSSTIKKFNTNNNDEISNNNKDQLYKIALLNRLLESLSSLPLLSNLNLYVILAPLLSNLTGLLLSLPESRHNGKRNETTIEELRQLTESCLTHLWSLCVSHSLKESSLISLVQNSVGLFSRPEVTLKLKLQFIRISVVPLSLLLPPNLTLRFLSILSSVINLSTESLAFACLLRHLSAFAALAAAETDISDRNIKNGNKYDLQNKKNLRECELGNPSYEDDDDSNFDENKIFTKILPSCWTREANRSLVLMGCSSFASRALEIWTALMNPIINVIIIPKCNNYRLRSLTELEIKTKNSTKSQSKDSDKQSIISSYFLICNTLSLLLYRLSRHSLPDKNQNVTKIESENLFLKNVKVGSLPLKSLGFLTLANIVPFKFWTALRDELIASSDFSRDFSFSQNLTIENRWEIFWSSRNNESDFETFSFGHFVKIQIFVLITKRMPVDKVIDFCKNLLFSASAKGTDSFTIWILLVLILSQSFLPFEVYCCLLQLPSMRGWRTLDSNSTRKDNWDSHELSSRLISLSSVEFIRWQRIFFTCESCSSRSLADLGLHFSNLFSQNEFVEDLLLSKSATQTDKDDILIHESETGRGAISQLQFENLKKEHSVWFKNEKSICILKALASLSSQSKTKEIQTPCFVFDQKDFEFFISFLHQVVINRLPQIATDETLKMIIQSLDSLLCS